MNRTDVLNGIAAVLDFRRYAEIGVRNPADNFDKIRCLERTGIDRSMIHLPAPGRSWELFCMTSDAFFERYPDRRFDLVFVDGNHMAEFVRRDVHNALRAIGDNPQGRVVMHDCNPPDDHHTHGSLCGTVYRAFLECRADPALDCSCVDCDYGVGVVRCRPNPMPLELPAEYDYAIFAEHRAEWLNLVPASFWEP